jgi:hypothetical protein
MRGIVCLVAVGLLDCQVFLDLNREQCVTDGDCDRVERGRVCRAGFCLTKENAEELRDKDTSLQTDASPDGTSTLRCPSNTYYCASSKTCVGECNTGCGANVVGAVTCDASDPPRVVPGLALCSAPPVERRACCSSLDCAVGGLCNKGTCLPTCNEATRELKCNVGTGREGTCRVTVGGMEHCSPYMIQ